MLFQGQEFWSSAPFAFFADHHADLAKLVRKGRHAEMGKFPRLADDAGQAQLHDPESDHTYHQSQLDWGEREHNAKIVVFHRELLRMRAATPAFSANHRPAVDGTVLGPEAFALRCFGPDGDDRLILVNLGRDIHRASIADPLVAPPRGREWQVAFSSEHPAYGGTGTPPVLHEAGWTVPGQTAVVLSPVPASKPQETTIADHKD